MFGQSFALIDRKHREGTQERDTPDRIAPLSGGSALLFPGHEPARVDDGYAVLAAPYRTAEHRCLPESEKGVARISVGDDRIPQSQDIDTAVGPLADGIVRHADARLGAGPRLDPRHSTSFEVGNDPVGDLLV